MTYLKQNNRDGDGAVPVAVLFVAAHFPSFQTKKFRKSRAFSAKKYP